MGYSLENPAECQRLEKQACMKAYLPDDEIARMLIRQVGKVLDAGCGTGLMSRALQRLHPNLEVHACDISKERLDFARMAAASSDLDEIYFFVSNLEDIQSDANAYDTAVCRYVLQHVDNPRTILRELHRVLVADGVLNVVEIDGILFNMHCDNVFVMDCLEELKRHFKFDLYVGRKIPVMMKECGFKSIDWGVETMAFKGAALRDEYALTDERLRFASPLITSILGGSKGSAFVEAYRQELLKPETTLFYTKFIVHGIKEAAGYGVPPA